MENKPDNKTVLFVDDQPEVLRLYSRGLEVSGYRVLTADSVEGGMEIIATEHVDAVLVDLKMPYINGMGMLYRLRKDHPHMPVAIVTGMQNLDKDTLKEIATLEATIRYKPLSIVQIQRLVDELITRKS
jgi:DNA-binding NtrC family response regulator